MKLIELIKSRFSNRPDSEHKQAIMRVLVGVATTVYFLPTALKPEYRTLLLGQTVFIVYIFSIPVWIYFNPGISRVRRYVGAFGDMAALTAAMILLGDAGLSVYALFIWVTSANGFRFGSHYLLVALILGIFGLTTVLAISPAMHEKSAFGLELIIIYTALCLYFNTLVKELHNSISRANQASDAKRQFLSNMSHELRTPLHVIVGLADMMKRSTSMEQIVELRDSMETSVNSMLRLVNDILDFSKIEAGKTEVRVTRFHLYQAMAETEKLFARASREKSITLKFFIDISVPPRLLGDVSHLHQVLNNLLSNAIKFTQQGHVGVCVRCLSVTENVATLEWTVEDTGIGIPKEKQAQIFDSFTQADAEVTVKYGGTGLGTTIARELIHLMGGRIGFTSEPGKGSTFWFQAPLRLDPDPSHDPINIHPVPVYALGFDATLDDGFSRSIRAFVKNEQKEESEIEQIIACSRHPPFGILARLHDGALPSLALTAIQNHIPVVAVNDHPMTPEARAELKAKGVLSVVDSLEWMPAAVELLQSWSRHQADVQELPHTGQLLCIVVADDNNTNLKIISNVLQYGGHQVIECKNGEEVLTVLTEQDIDLAIMDMNMPVLDGISATKMIRAMPNPLGSIPIALLTADATDASRKKAAEAKVTAFLTKPIKPRALLEEILRIASEAGLEMKPQAEVKELSHPSAKVMDEQVIDYLKKLAPDENFLPQLIADYLKDAQIRLQGLEDAVASNDHLKWRNELHRFQGGSASLGLDRLVSVMAQSRSVAPDKLRTEGQREIHRIREALSEARSALLAVH